MPTTRTPRTPHHAPLAVGAALAAIAVLTGCTSLTPGAVTAEQVLADGAVSDAEYRSAIDSVAACIQAAGWQASTPQPAADRVRLTIGVSPKDTADPTEEEPQIDAALATHDQCFTNDTTRIEAMYLAQHVPTGTAREQMLTELLVCLDHAGIPDVARHAREQQIVTAITRHGGDTANAGFGCLDRYQLAFTQPQTPA
jgi:hypothetical protein